MKGGGMGALATPAKGERRDRVVDAVLSLRRASLGRGWWE